MYPVKVICKWESKNLKANTYIQTVLAHTLQKNPFLSGNKTTDRYTMCPRCFCSSCFVRCYLAIRMAVVFSCYYFYGILLKGMTCSIYAMLMVLRQTRFRIHLSMNKETDLWYVIFCDIIFTIVYFSFRIGFLRHPILWAVFYALVIGTRTVFKTFSICSWYVRLGQLLPTSTCNYSKPLTIDSSNYIDV